MVIQLPSSMSPNRAEAINTLLAAYNTENLRNSLMAYPARIKKQREVVNQARKALKDTELGRATREAELLLSIGTETDEKGKAKYSNAEQRAAELLRRKSTDPAYLDAAGAVAAEEAEASEAQDALQMLLDEYLSARAAASLIAKELGVIAELAGMDEVDEVKVLPVPGSEQLVGDQSAIRQFKSKEAF